TLTVSIKTKADRSISFSGQKPWIESMHKTGHPNSSVIDSSDTTQCSLQLPMRSAKSSSQLFASMPSVVGERLTPDEACELRTHGKLELQFGIRSSSRVQNGYRYSELLSPSMFTQGKQQHRTLLEDSAFDSGNNHIVKDNEGVFQLSESHLGSFSQLQIIGCLCCAVLVQFLIIVWLVARYYRKQKESTETEAENIEKKASQDKRIAELDEGRNNDHREITLYSLGQANDVILGFCEEVEGFEKEIEGLKEEIEGLKEEVKGLKETTTDQKERLVSLNARLMESDRERKTLLENVEDLLRCVLDLVRDTEGYDAMKRDSGEYRMKGSMFEILKIVFASFFENTAERFLLIDDVRTKSNATNTPLRSYAALNADLPVLTQSVDAGNGTEARDPATGTLRPFLTETGGPRHLNMHQITISFANAALRLMKMKLKTFMDIPANGFHDPVEKKEVLDAFPTEWDALLLTYAMLQNDAAVDPNRDAPPLDNAFASPVAVRSAESRQAALDVSSDITERLDNVITPRTRPANEKSNS
ncbi:MAG: hypothetical protein SGILL_007578, partial [Bacillariaceae sp.]